MANALDDPEIRGKWNELYDWMGDVLAHQKATEKWQKDMLDAQRKGFEAVADALKDLRRAVDDLTRVSR